MSGEIETVQFKAPATLMNVSRVGVVRLLSMRAIAGCVNLDAVARSFCVSPWRSRSWMSWSMICAHSLVIGITYRDAFFIEYFRCHVDVVVPDDGVKRYVCLHKQADVLER